MLRRQAPPRGRAPRFPHRAEVSVVWRAFELDPRAPRTADAVPYAERLARKYGKPVPEAQAMIDRLAGIAADDGLEMRFDRIRPGNTFDAHRLLHLARAHGVQDALKERLFRAYFTEGEAIGDRDVLARLAADVGLDAEAARAALADDDGARAVRADEEEARALGIGGVPFFVVGGRYAVSGAQPAEVLLGALTQAWDHAEGRRDPAEGAACGPEGCA